MRLIDADMLLANARTFLEKAETDAYYTGSREVKAHWDDAMRLIKEMPTASQWIPCKERLPKRGVDVLTYSELVNFVEIQSIEPHFGNDCWENQHGDLQELNTVTVWMPLPEPYTEEEEDG